MRSFSPWRRSIVDTVMAGKSLFRALRKAQYEAHADAGCVRLKDPALKFGKENEDGTILLSRVHILVLDKKECYCAARLMGLLQLE